MKKILLLIIVLFFVPITVNAKTDKWADIKCTIHKNKVICKIYSTKTAIYPNAKKFSLYLKYKNVSFDTFVSNRKEIKASGSIIYLTPLTKKISKNELLGTLTLNIRSTKNMSVSINKFYYEFKNNSKYNNNWLFIGDSFFDMLDGVNMNSKSSTILSNGYYNHTDNDYKLTNGRAEPSLGKINSLGISGATTALFSEYFNGYDLAWLPEYPKLNDLPKNINKVAVYLGTNDSKKFHYGDLSYSPDMEKQYMKNIIDKLSHLYNQPEIYIFRVFSRPEVENEEEILKKYNAKYLELSKEYQGKVQFINTEYLSGYQLADKTGMIRENYYASSSKKGYGYAGHFTVDAYNIWVDNIITSLNMNYNVPINKILVTKK